MLAGQDNAVEVGVEAEVVEVVRVVELLDPLVRVVVGEDVEELTLRVVEGVLGAAGCVLGEEFRSMFRGAPK